MALVACKSQGKVGGAGSQPQAPVAGSQVAPVPSPGSAATPTPPAGESAEARARALLEHQIELARSKPDDLPTTFAQDAIVIAGNRSTTPDGIATFGIGDAGPDGATVTKASITKLIAGGNANAVWFYAEVTVEGGGTPGVTRAVELLAAPDWHAVAASFETPGKLQPSGNNREIENATGSDGPLVKLLASPPTIAAQLAPDAIVIGPEAGQLAQSAEARTALAGWKLEPLTLFQRGREVTKPTWGFVQAHFDRPDPAHPKLVDRVIGQAFAVPKPDGTWSVVLVQYAGR